MRLIAVPRNARCFRIQIIYIILWSTVETRSATTTCEHVFCSIKRFFIRVAFHRWNEMGDLVFNRKTNQHIPIKCTEWSRWSLKASHNLESDLNIYNFVWTSVLATAIWNIDICVVVRNFTSSAFESALCIKRMTMSLTQNGIQKRIQKTSSMGFDSCVIFVLLDSASLEPNNSIFHFVGLFSGIEHFNLQIQYSTIKMPIVQTTKSTSTLKLKL